MPQPQGADLEAVRVRRAELRAKYLQDRANRPTPTVRGVHHLALICKDVEQTIQFYQGLLGFPLVELVENRDYAGSSYFFFDIGNRTLLAFFDFPGHGHPDFNETIGGVHHLALSTSVEEFEAARKRLTDACIPYLGPDRGVENSLYIRDPNGTGIEFCREDLGYGKPAAFLLTPARRYI